MIKEIITTEGNAGTGKTTSMYQTIKEYIAHGFVCLYTCFNKYLKKKASNHLPQSHILLVSNIHSLCFRFLKALDKLPEKFQSIKDYSETDNSNLTGKDFDNLLKTFLSINTDSIKQTLHTLDHIFIDEAQDFSPLYFNVIKHLGNAFDITLHIYGDRNQRITKDFKSNKPLEQCIFDSPELYFPNIKITKKYLNQNHRTANEAILQFINGYLSQSYDNYPKELLYTNTIGQLKNKYELPTIQFFSNKSKEYERVKSLTSTFDSSLRIAILSRWKRDLKLYHDNKSFLGNNVTINTINSFKGLEADIVFLVGFQAFSQDDIIEKNLFYTAASRACKKLYITSAYPAFDLSKYFIKDSFKMIGKQTAITKPFKKLKDIKPNRNFSMQKFRDNIIDSISVKVTFKDAPFLPYVQNSFIAGRDRKNYGWQKIQVNNFEGVGYVIKNHHVHKSYSFEFFDLNILKKNNFTDKQVVQLISNIILEFFNYRLNLNQLKITRLDLYKLFKFNNELSRNTFLDEFATSISMSMNNSIKDHNNYTLEHRKSILNTLQDSTVYINHSKTKDITTVCYDPRNKVNQNKILSDNLFKIEQRLRGNALQRKYTENFNTMDSLMKIVADENKFDILISLLHRQNLSLPIITNATLINQEKKTYFNKGVNSMNKCKKNDTKEKTGYLLYNLVDLFTESEIEEILLSEETFLKEEIPHRLVQHRVFL
ncbi:MAG: ATP-binding domain-containing protein [Eubacteriales bacterium]